MATVSGTNMAKALAPTPATYMGPEFEGKLHTIVENYTFASAAIGTVVRVGRLNKGEVFVSGQITGADLGSATTLQMGDLKAAGEAVGDADRYLAATVFTTANQKTDCNALAGRGYKATEDMIITVETAVEEATGRIDVVIIKAVP